MAEINYATLQKKYGGEYIVRKGKKVLFHSPTYDQLDDRLKKSKVDVRQVIIEYIEPNNIVCVY